MEFFSLGKKSIRETAAVAGTVALGILAFGLANAYGGSFGQSSGTCYLSEQLKDSQARYEYVERVVELRGGGRVYNAATGRYGEISLASYQTAESGNLDPMSSECLSCHDGSSAPLTGYSHPVGVQYPAFSRSGRYVSKGALNRRIVLIDGKVGCLSCHNPLNPSKFHLVMSNDGSRLCFSCHLN